MLKSLEVAFVLVGIGIGEFRKSPLERRSISEITGDGDAVARAGVGSGQRLRANPEVPGEARRDRPFDVEASLPVPELADVEVPGHAVRTFEGLMSQKYVACRLHQVLAGHHSRPMVGVTALADELLEHGRLRLFG